MNRRPLRLAVIFMLIVITFAGCAPTTYWTRANFNEYQWNRDLAQCRYESSAYTPNEYRGPGMANAIAAGMSQGMRQNDLLALCLQARGYYRVPAN
jgi:hypothetical protein